MISTAAVITEDVISAAEVVVLTAVEITEVVIS